MELYVSPMACSLASRISIYEAKAEADTQFIEVDPKTKRTLEGTNYLEIYPLGLVPCFASKTARSSARTPRSSNTSQTNIRMRNSRRAIPSSGRGSSNGCASSAPSCTRPSSFRCSIKKHQREREGTR